MRRHPSPTLSLVVALVAITTPLGAASVRQFNLAEITQRAAKIYVGTVRTATEGMRRNRWWPPGCRDLPIERRRRSARRDA